MSFSRIIGGLTLLASLGAGPDFSQVGFSTVNALGDNGTTGGGAAAPVNVHNAQELRTAAERLDIKDKTAREKTPRVVLIASDIDLGELKNMDPAGTELKDVGIIRPASNTTIMAAGAGATLRHGTIEVHAAHNVIIRNLAFRDLWEFDPSGNYDKLSWDYVRITRQGDRLSHHVWVDHCDFGKCYDGQLDVVHGSDFVTVSWCRFSGDQRGPQKKGNLIGHSSSNAAQDKGRLNVTFHHNWYENVEERAPRARFGNIHCFNNYIDGATTASIAVVGATMLIQGNYYHDVQVATTFSHAADTTAKERNGIICIVDSINDAPRATPATNPSRQLELAQNFKGNIEPAMLEFSIPLATDMVWQDRKQLPYKYTVDRVVDVPQIVRQYAGVGKIGL